MKKKNPVTPIQIADRKRKKENRKLRVMGIDPTSPEGARLRELWNEPQARTDPSLERLFRKRRRRRN